MNDKDKQRPTVSDTVLRLASMTLNQLQQTKTIHNEPQRDTMRHNKPQLTSMRHNKAE